MIRLFAGLPVPDDIADRLEPLQTGLDGARWRGREHFHVTLGFFGDVIEPAAREHRGKSRIGRCRGEGASHALRGGRCLADTRLFGRAKCGRDNRAGSDKRPDRDPDNGPLCIQRQSFATLLVGNATSTNRSRAKPRFGHLGA